MSMRACVFALALCAAAFVAVAVAQPRAGGAGAQAVPPPPLTASAAAASAHHNVEPVDPNELHLADDSPALAHAHHSLEPPYSVNIPLPYWDDGANAKVAERYVRLTEDRQSKTGFLWNNVPSTMTDWEVTFEFSVTGRPMMGGDGFAFWYVEKPGLLGPVYGSSDYWQGLLIAFDTFNNDGQGRSPMITVHNNDGTRTFEHAWDGEHGALSSCHSMFRNRPQTSFARVTYQSRALTLDLGLDRGADGNPIWERCFSVAEVDLGVDKYFGITAHTGDVADNHDVYSIRTRDLSPTSDPQALEHARAHYRDEQHDTTHHPGLAEQPAAEFQHNVLTLLHQIQSATNMLETTTIAIGDLLTSQQQVKELEAAHEEVEDDDESEGESGESEEDDGEDEPGAVHPTAHDAHPKRHKNKKSKSKSKDAKAKANAKSDGAVAPPNPPHTGSATPVVTPGTPAPAAAAAAPLHPPVTEKHHKESMYGQTRIVEKLTLIAETQSSLANSVAALSNALDAKIAVALKSSLEHEITAFRVQEHQYFQESISPLRDDIRQLQALIRAQNSPGANAGYAGGVAGGSGSGSGLWVWIVGGVVATGAIVTVIWVCTSSSRNTASRWPKSHI